jgi:hypothetical protein
MKVWSIFCILCLSLFFPAGCAQTIAPKEEFREQYVLQAFVQGGMDRAPMTMNALIARTYDVDGFDPSLNTTDPSIDGAVVIVRVWSRRDTLKEWRRVSKDSSRYGTIQRYYSGTIQTPWPGDPVYLSARLPNGKELTVQTTIPQPLLVQPDYIFSRGRITKANIPPAVNRWTVNWKGDASAMDHAFFPRLQILYSRRVNAVDVEGAVFVPMTFVDKEAVYPTFIFGSSCSFDFAAIDSALAQLSAGDPQKTEYKIRGAVFEVMEFDDPLSKYYSSINGALDPYSVRINNPVFSNVGGGVGIFGSSFINQYICDLDTALVTPFGYRTR